MQLENELTLKEIAKWLRLHPVTIQRWISKKKLTGGKKKKYGKTKKWIFTKEQVQKYLERKK